MQHVDFTAQDYEQARQRANPCTLTLRTDVALGFEILLRVDPDGLVLIRRYFPPYGNYPEGMTHLLTTRRGLLHSRAYPKCYEPAYCARLAYNMLREVEAEATPSPNGEQL